METRGPLQSRLQTIEQELRQIKEKSLMVDNKNFQKLCDMIETLIAEVKKDLDETKDALSETEACVEEMGQDFVKKAGLQSHLDKQIKAAVEKIVKIVEDGDDQPERGLYLTGVGRLRESLVSPPDDRMRRGSHHTTPCRICSLLHKNSTHPPLIKNSEGHRPSNSVLHFNLPPKVCCCRTSPTFCERKVSESIDS